jgi:F0F1-type ATP synthase membrane subunit b/b'
MENINILLIFSVLGFTFGLLGTIIGLIACVKVLAMEKSTHTITYQPIDDEIEKANEEVMKKWATKESAIAKDQELFREDLETEMPDFFPDEDEKEIISL